MNKRFTSREVVALTGITLRQLQWWDERRIVIPARDGHRRLYSTEDLAEVAVICELRLRGFSLQRVRKVMRFLQREFSKRLDCRHSQEFPSAHADHLSQRHRPPGARRSPQRRKKS